MTKIYPVLMVGGSGTRLWPVSRLDRPKQFQKLVGNELTLFQQTVLRLTGQFEAFRFANPVIIGAERYRELIEAQLAEINVTPGRIVLEPSARNTAAVAAIAAASVLEQDPEGLVLMTPSDHHISDAEAFQHAINQSVETAKAGWIVTFGIRPTRPDTGFGYIEAGAPLDTGARRITAFTEKPDLDTAKRWLAAGRHTWNAGLFLFSPGLMLSELKTHAVGVHEASLKAFRLGRENGIARSLDKHAFERTPEISIDFAVMEHTDKAAVFGPLDCGWNDVGSWATLAEMADGAAHTDVLDIGSTNCYLRSDGSVFVAGVGLEDLIVVAHEGSVLVIPRDRVQDIKGVVAALKSNGQFDRL